MSNQSRRPIGMTILLILSLAYASLQIFSNLGMFLTLPTMGRMMADGTMEQTMTPVFTAMQADESTIKAYWEIIESYLSINRAYFLFTAMLYTGVLIGAIRMFKLERIGFHIYSISKMLLLIVAVIYLYAKQGYSMFFNEFLQTVMFILIYHLFLKRIENETAKREQDI